MVIVYAGRGAELKRCKAGAGSTIAPRIDGGPRGVEPPAQSGAWPGLTTILSRSRTVA